MASSQNISLIWLLKNVKEPLQGTWQSLLLIITTVLNFSRHSRSSSLSRSASKEVKKKIIIIILVVTKGYRVWATTMEGQNIFAPTLCFRKFHVIDGQNMRFTIRLWVIESPNASDQIAFCAFHSFLVEVQMNAGYIHVTHAWYQPGD